MPTVERLADVEANLRQLAAYLNSPDADERQFACELVRNGRCFVVVGYGEDLEAITADETVLVMPDGTRETWTRAPAE